MKWTVRQWGLMIITITVIGESCLPLRAAIRARAYELTSTHLISILKDKKKENGGAETAGY